jgi:hypothetical protein
MATPAANRVDQEGRSQSLLAWPFFFYLALLWSKLPIIVVFFSCALNQAHAHTPPWVMNIAIICIM